MSERASQGSTKRPSLIFRLTGILIILFVTYTYLHDLGRNPYGLFADEALIGIKTRALVNGAMPDGRLALFFDHFGTVAGALPIYTTVPFVWAFGLSEFSLRLSSAFFTIATAIVL